MNIHFLNCWIFFIGYQVLPAADCSIAVPGLGGLDKASLETLSISCTLTIHVQYIYLQNWVVWGVHVGKYASPMDAMAYVVQFLIVSLGNAFFKLNCSVISYVCLKLCGPSRPSETSVERVWSDLCPVQVFHFVCQVLVRIHWVELYMSIELGKP